MVDLVFCGDRNIIFGMAVSVRSALDHCSETANIHIICEGFQESDKETLRKSFQHENLGTVVFEDLDASRVSSFRSTAYLKSKMSYARYYIADFFPSLKKCVYLDIDLLVYKDVAELMHMDLGDNVLAAAIDIAARAEFPDYSIGQRLGLKDPKKYFNAGVLVIDLDHWRANDTTAKIVDLTLEKADILHSQDQDALNIMFEDKILELDICWNVSQYEKPFPVNGNVVHLLGTIKPWHARYARNFSEDYYKDVIHDTFFEILDQTEYAGERPWDTMGIGKLTEELSARIPTMDMVTGKVRRVLKSAF